MDRDRDGDWAFRPVLAPRSTLFTTEEFARLFSLSPDTIRRAVTEGRLPPPRAVSKGVSRFTWEHAVLYRLLITLTPAESRGRDD